MVSRRNLITILLMMLTIFFMFQFTQMVKFRNGKFDTNEYAKEPEQFASGLQLATLEEGYVVYLGDDTTKQFKAVSKWCDNNRKYLVNKTSLNAASEAILKDAEIVFVDGQISGGDDPDKLESLTECGTPVVFVRIPDYEAIKSSRKMRKILGIRKAKSEEVTALGIQFFEGFLIGGEAAYMPQKEEEEKYNDLDLTLSWFETAKGTEAYVVGMLDEKEYEAEEFPRIIWRNTYNDTFIVVVANEILDEEMGPGILNSIVYEVKDYYVYPVVNAQNVVLSDFPYVTDVNQAEIRRIYSMNTKSLSRDIMWPAILSLATNDNFKLSCFLNPSNANIQDEKTSTEMLEFYLKQLQEVEGEIGKSLNSNDTNQSAEEIIARDESFYNCVPKYEFVAAYSEEIPVIENPDEIGLNTIITKNADTEVSYLSDNITCQKITNNADEYTYSTSLRNRCILNALGYSNTLMDTARVLNPENSADEWQNYSKEVFGNVDTIYCNNKYFDFTSASESDQRVRNYLNVKYSYEYKDGLVYIYTDNVEEAYFIFRTQNEDIAAIENAECTKLEKDTYLIHANKGTVIISLEESEDILHYQKPF